MSGGGGTTTVEKSDPWEEQKPYLTHGFEQAQNLLAGDQPAYFPDSTIAPQSQNTLYAQQGMANRAMMGSPLVQQAQQLNSATMAGDYFDPTRMDPYFDQARKSIDSQFAGGGRYGSGLHKAALGEEFGQIAAGQYDRERGYQNAAMGNAIPLANQDYADLQALGDVGRMQDLRGQQELQSDIERFDYDQNLDQNKLNAYMNLVQGNYGGTASSTSSQNQSGLSTAMGIGSMILPLLMMSGGSDRRIKRDITLLRHESGLPIYRWRYLWSDKFHEGPMAQDVLKVMPELVGRNIFGFLTIPARMIK